MLCLYRLRHSSEDRGREEWNSHKAATNKTANRWRLSKPQWPPLMGHSYAPFRLLVNINERCVPCKRPYLFSYLLGEPGNCGWASINITLPHPQGSALLLLDVNDVYTCACGGGPLLWTAAIAHDGAGPQAGGTQLAGQNQPASVGGRLGHSSEEPGCLWRFITGHKSPLRPATLPPCPGALFYRLSAGLIRADMLSVLGWTDIAIAGVCVCVCVRERECVYVRCCGSLEAVRDSLCVMSSSGVGGHSNKRLLDWARNTASGVVTWNIMQCKSDRFLCLRLCE